MSPDTLSFLIVFLGGKKYRIVATSISSELDNLGSNTGSSLSSVVSTLIFLSLDFSPVNWTHTVLVGVALHLFSQYLLSELRTEQFSTQMILPTRGHLTSGWRFGSCN